MSWRPHRPVFEMLHSACRATAGISSPLTYPNGNSLFERRISWWGVSAPRCPCSEKLQLNAEELQKEVNGIRVEKVTENLPINNTLGSPRKSKRRRVMYNILQLQVWWRLVKTSLFGSRKMQNLIQETQVKYKAEDVAPVVVFPGCTI